MTTDSLQNNLLSPHDQLLNVARSLESALDSRRHVNRQIEIEGCSRQLIEMIRSYCDGKLAAIKAADDDLPF